MKAIVLPYSSYQNEPSIPNRKLFDMDEDNRDERLKDLWFERFDSERELDVEITIRVIKDDPKLRWYGDYQVTDLNGSSLFLTVIED